MQALPKLSSLPTFEELAKAPDVQVILPKKSFTTFAAVPEVKTTRVACYCRVSTDGESQKSSIAIQRQHFLTQAAIHQDWEFAGIYCDIVSGTKKEKRPELQKLLQSCRDGRVDLVLTKSISRFARNTTDLLEMVRSLSALSIGIVFDRENIDTRTMESEFLLTLLASLAEDESHSISSNCRWGIQKRFQDGTYKISTAPYGYDVDNGKLVINEDEAKIVREIYSAFLGGKSAYQISLELNRDGIQTKRAGEVQKSGRVVSGLWDTTSVTRLLDSETYTGDMILQKTYKDETFTTRKNDGEYQKVFVEADHDAIISHETYEKAKELRNRKKHYSRKTSRRYPYTGMLICARCGAPLTRQKTKSGYIYWTCSEHRKDSARCDQPNVKEENILEAFGTVLKGMLPELQDYRSRVEQEWRSDTDVNALEEKLGNAEKSLSSLEMERPRMSTTDYIEKKNKIRLEQEEARSGLYLIRNSKLEQTEELIQKTNLCNSSSVFLRDTFHKVVKKVKAHDRNNFTFCFKCGFEYRGGAETEIKTRKPAKGAGAPRQSHPQR